VQEVSEALPTQERLSLWSMRVDPTTANVLDAPRQMTAWIDHRSVNLAATPDGKRLVFLKMRSQMNVYIAEIAARATKLLAPHRFTLDDRDNYPSAWTKDSRSILFYSARNGAMEIFRQALNDSIPETIV